MEETEYNKIRIFYAFHARKESLLVRIQNILKNKKIREFLISLCQKSIATLAIYMQP